MTVLVTGGAGGIGADISTLFASAGWNVAVNYFRSKSAAESLTASLTSDGLSAEAYYADVSSETDVKKMVSEIYDRFGGIDALVNNAGISHFGLFTETEPEVWAHIRAVNLGGVYNCCRAVLPRMLSVRHGRIINISSMWGVTGASCEVAYSAAKAGVIGLTRALAKEVGPSGITVNCVAPGLIDTPMNADLTQAELAALIEQTPMGIIGVPRDVSSLVLYLASDLAGFITGQVIGVNGGLVI
jgi:3-oxoacyl-[acyl-carrier protein] reductase